MDKANVCHAEVAAARSSSSKQQQQQGGLAQLSRTPTIAPAMTHFFGELLPAAQTEDEDRKKDEMMIWTGPLFCLKKKELSFFLLVIVLKLQNVGTMTLGG